MDSADLSSFLIAKMELFNLILHPDLRETPILVYANKQDLEDSVGVEQIAEELNLTSIRNHDWTIVPCSAMDGVGLYEGLDWITSMLISRNG